MNRTAELQLNVSAMVRRFLMASAGQAVSRTEIANLIYHDNPSITKRQADQYINLIAHNIREYIQGTGDELITVHGYGYIYKKGEQ